MVLEEIDWPPRKATADQVLDDVDLSGRYVVVTGANTGIGFETAKALAKRNAHVVLACRDVKKALAAKELILSEACCGGKDGGKAPNVVEMHLDLADLGSVEHFAAEYREKGWPLHVLILNAGVLMAQDTHTGDGFETTFQVNHLAQWYLLQLLFDVVQTSVPSRVIFASSAAFKRASLKKAEDFGNEEKLSPAIVGGAAKRLYCNSKLCNILTVNHLARLTYDSNVMVFAVHPGNVKTELTRNGHLFILPNFRSVSSEQGAAGQVFLATAAGLDTLSGEFFDGVRPKSTGAITRSSAAAAELWETSRRLILKWKETREAKLKPTPSP